MNKIVFSVCLLLVCTSPYCFSEEKFNNNAYFDLATGHKYVKLDNASFAEFSQKDSIPVKKLK